ncbi:MAG: M15 family metallopeptidase [Oscillospiraceae bacterium]|nr:M15 family metallopeptidase [Oscillospiraceae bacterium]
MGNHPFRAFFSGFAAAVLTAALTVLCTWIFLTASGWRFPIRETAGEAGAANPSSEPSSSTSLPMSKTSNNINREEASASSAYGINERDLVLVGPSNKLPGWYKPKLISAFGIRMDSDVVEPYTKMHAAAAKDGISLWISSAYRSDELQEKLFRQEVRQFSKSSADSSAAETCAEKAVARPGYSEHATGLALDLNGVKSDFDQTAAFRWMDRHAAKYGFILRYPKSKQAITKIEYEPWHYRYVGQKNAEAIKESDLCLEEYLTVRQKGSSSD